MAIDFNGVFQDPQWVIAIATMLSAVATFGVSIVALFGDALKSWLNQPVIKFGLSKNEPHIVQAMRNMYPIWYFRLRVKNIGKTVAKNCHIKIKSVIPITGKLDFPFEQSVLKWSSAPRDMRYREDPENIIKDNVPLLTPIFRELKDIPPLGGWEMCDLFETVGNGFITFLSLGRREISVGDHIMTIEIFGDNLEPKEKKFRISPSNDFRQVKIDAV